MQCTRFTHILAYFSGTTATADGKRLVSASYDHTLRLWEVERSTRSLIRKMTGHTAEVYCVATSPDGQWIASGSADTERSGLTLDRVERTTLSVQRGSRTKYIQKFKCKTSCRLVQRV